MGIVDDLIADDAIQFEYTTFWGTETISSSDERASDYVAALYELEGSTTFVSSILSQISSSTPFVIEIDSTLENNGYAYVGSHKVTLGATLEIVYIDNFGQAQEMSIARLIAHESVHAVLGLRDTTDSLDGSIADPDYDGPTVTLTNEIMGELGETARGSYSAATLASYIEPGTEFTFGNEVENVIMNTEGGGNATAPGESDGDIDTSNNTVLTSDLVVMRDYFTGSSSNTISTGLGDDYIYAGRGEDTIYAGEGNDYIDAGTGDDEIYTGLGDDYIVGGNGDDTIDAGEGDDHIDAGTGEDKIYAGEGDDHIESGGSADKIYAGEGNDYIDAGTARDTIYAGKGDDYIVGGTGDDTFVFEQGDGVDTIADFEDACSFLWIFNTRHDQLRIDVDGFDSYNDVEEVMYQDGSDVVIDFGGGDSLVLLGKNLSDIDAFDFGFV